MSVARAAVARISDRCGRGGPRSPRTEVRGGESRCRIRSTTVGPSTATSAKQIAPRFAAASQPSSARCKNTSARSNTTTVRRNWAENRVSAAALKRAPEPDHRREMLHDRPVERAAALRWRVVVEDLCRFGRGLRRLLGGRLEYHAAFLASEVRSLAP